MIVTRVQTESGKCTLAILVGANARLSEDLDRFVNTEGVRVEAAGSLAELALFDLKDIGVILAWDEGETIELLFGQLVALGCRLPVLAIGERATVRQVVRAMNCGVVDYIDWPEEAHLLPPAIRNASEGTNRPRSPVARRDRAHQALSRLSTRERQVLGLMAEGMTNKHIARSLKISPRTVEIHRANMLEKLKSKSSAGAIRLFLEAAEFPADEAAHRPAGSSEHAAAECETPSDRPAAELRDDQ